MRIALLFGGLLLSTTAALAADSSLLARASKQTRSDLMSYRVAADMPRTRTCWCRTTSGYTYCTYEPKCFGNGQLCVEYGCPNPQ